jgi:cytidylate kinase
MIVTIDGPAASGKGTLARGIAERLGFDFLDTGAMYRTVALAAMRQGIACDDASAVSSLLPRLEIVIRAGRAILNGEDVEDAIRVPDVSQNASKVAAIPSVRAFLIPQQRRIAHGRDIVCEGRDQGTVVFPDAPVKFFITADVQARAERRYRQLVAQGRDTTLQREVSEIIERDRRDTEREDGPLREPPDAIHVDTTDLTPEQVLDRLEGVIRKWLTART